MLKDFGDKGALITDAPALARSVLGTADWCSKHFRFDGGEARVVYDWDSLGLDHEPAGTGAAAAVFPANRHLPRAPDLPSPQETLLFARDYEAARRVPFSEAERETVAAATIYAMAYLARREHAADPGGEEGGTRGGLPGGTSRARGGLLPALSAARAGHEAEGSRPHGGGSGPLRTHDHREAAP